MVTPDLTIPNPSKAEKDAYKALLGSLLEQCKVVTDANGVKLPFPYGEGPGMAVSGGGKINRNGLDGVIEVMRTENFASYTIQNEGKMCIASESTNCEGQSLKCLIADSDPNSPT